MAKYIITGANGHLGRRLLERLQGKGHGLHALVRSASAAATIAPHRDVSVHVVDYTSAAALEPLVSGADAVVHLVGIIRETPQNRYVDAHESTCRALVEAVRRASVSPRIVYVSILGSSSAHANACLRSKGAAEDLLLAGGLPVTVLQVPMVLGEGDYATMALRNKARSAWSVGFRMSSREQPIYAGDVVNAIVAALDRACGRLSLAGPESLPRDALVRRAGQILGTRPKCISLPIGPGRFVVGVLEKVLPHPPMTRAMLDVLDHDDAIDPLPAADHLGITLTPLDEMLRSVLGALQ